MVAKKEAHGQVSGRTRFYITPIVTIREAVNKHDPPRALLAVQKVIPAVPIRWSVIRDTNRRWHRIFGDVTCNCVDIAMARGTMIGRWEVDEV